MLQSKTVYTATILADSVGKNINAITELPNCLKKNRDHTQIEDLVNVLSDLEIDEIDVVVGYKNNMIKKEKDLKSLNFNLLLNENYLLSGNAYSLYLGLKNSKGPTLVLDTDITFDCSLIKNFVNFAPENSFLCKNVDIENILACKVFTNKNNIIKSFANGRHPNITEVNRMIFQGEAIGVFKLSEEYKNELILFLENLFVDEYYTELSWEKIFNLFLKSKDFTAYKTKST